MNLILLFDDDFIAPGRARLAGRRLAHVTAVHRASEGDALTVGVAGGTMGRGVVTRLDGDALELEVTLDAEPPPPLPLTLVLALPRPKVLNRVIAGATSLGIKHIVLVNAWRVEKSYWKSPRLADDNLRLQATLGLEQARDTILPRIEIRRLFRPFVEEELPNLPNAFAAHPAATEPAPRNLGHTPSTLIIGPEGGWIEQEVASLARAGCTLVTLGERILLVETAVAALVGRVSSER